MKLGITLDDELVKRIDEYADTNYMSRSGLLSLAVTQFLNAADVSQAIKDMALAMRKIADNGEIDEDTRAELEEFERVAKYLTNSN